VVDLFIWELNKMMPMKGVEEKITSFISGSVSFAKRRDSFHFYLLFGTNKVGETMFLFYSTLCLSLHYLSRTVEKGNAVGTKRDELSPLL
jgi:hypothetical protein